MMGANDLLDTDVRVSLAERQQTISRVSAVAYRILESEDGQELMKHLESTFLLVPVVTANATQFEAGIREGQNSLVRYLSWLAQEFRDSTNEEHTDE